MDVKTITTIGKLVRDIKLANKTIARLSDENNARLEEVRTLMDDPTLTMEDILVETEE